ncbi:MAG: NAD(P)/FAD-dependent oxidoreductase, partial [Nevskia sp.]|nr:NAD(P)/FAD-dependent oxidoreductase [Nevskia sp.]
EMQLDYIFQLIELVRCGRCRAVVPAAEPTRRFNQALREAMKGTVWLSGCKSWYLDKNGNPATWPWSFEQFVQDMRAPDLRDFELVA